MGVVKPSNPSIGIKVGCSIGVKCNQRMEIHYSYKISYLVENTMNIGASRCKSFSSNKIYDVLFLRDILNLMLHILLHLQ